MTMNNAAGTAGTVQTQNGGSEEGIPFQYDDDSRPALDAAPQDGSRPAEQDPATDTDADPADGAGAEGDGEGDDGSSRTASDDGDKRNNVPAKQRIKQLSDRAKAAEQRARTAEGREQRLAAELAALGKRERPGDPVDYETDAQYTQALVKESVDAAREGWLTQQRQDAAIERHEARMERWSEQTQEMRERAPDFDTVMMNPAVQVTELMRDTIMDDPHGPEVIYYLGKNPAESAGVARLPLHQQAAAIGRLSERLSAPVARKQTQAKNPPVTLKGTGSPPTRDPAKMGNEEYRAWRAEQNKARATVRAR